MQYYDIDDVHPTAAFSNAFNFFDLERLKDEVKMPEEPPTELHNVTDTADISV